MKISRGMTDNALKCKFNGGSITYGYYIDEDGHFQPEPVQALIVADIFGRFAGGESAKSIVASLNEQRKKSNFGNETTYSFITHILKNRRYLGEYRFRDTLVENAFTQLVEPETFEKCQRRMEQNNAALPASSLLRISTC